MPRWRYQTIHLCGAHVGRGSLFRAAPQQDLGEGYRAGTGHLGLIPTHFFLKLFDILSHYHINMNKYVFVTIEIFVRKKKPLSRLRGFVRMFIV